MRFVKKINNNVALAEDVNNREWIIIGKGISFNKKANEKIPDDHINRKFISYSDNSPILEVTANIDFEILEVVNEICNQAEDDLDVIFSDTDYISLANHLDFAVKRAKENYDYGNESSWKLRTLFPEQYKFAKKTLDFIEKRLGVRLSETELNFMAYNYISSTADHEKSNSLEKIARIKKEIVDVVEKKIGTDIDRNNIHYSRFIDDLNYLAIEKINLGNEVDNELDLDILEVLSVKYPRAAKITDEVEEYLLKKENWILAPSEKAYLILHIRRLVQMVERDRKCKKGG